jgi:PAS domain S-box-containing protein
VSLSAFAENGDDISRCSRIFGPGEMAERTRAFDWNQSSLGPMEQWPESLLNIVNTLLECPHPMFLWWGKNLVQFYNDAYRLSLGDDKHPLALGQNGRDCWPEIWPVIGPQIERVMSTGKPTASEDQLIPIFRNGKLEDVYWTYAYSPVRDATGEICGTLVICTETTKRQVTERNLRGELKRLADLFEQAPAFFAVLRGPQHIFERINPLYQQLLGPRDVIGKSVIEAVPEVKEQGFITLLDRVYETGEPFIGRDTPIQLARRGSDELEERTLDFVYQPMREPDETVSGIIAFGIDVTEAKRAEKAALQSEKLAAVGRLASSIAHEINNPLASITNLIYLACGSAVNAETKEYLTTAEIELRRVAAITNQTLRFYRQSTAPQRTTAPAIIERALAIYQGRLSNTGIAVLRRDRGEQQIYCFEGEIQQVVSNLIGNAIDAMYGSDGTLMVRSREGTHWGLGKRGIVVTVADSGVGMSHETALRIFEPFFTTKGINGTGLGLWLSKDIIKRHHGRMGVRSSQSSKHSGTVFTVFLPYDAILQRA